MATEVYGASDDLVEVEGDVMGEASGDDVLLTFSDGTVLRVFYEKNKKALWGIDAVRKGDLFDRIDECNDEDAARYSDTAHFRDGLKWAYAASEFEKVR